MKCDAHVEDEHVLSAIKGLYLQTQQGKVLHNCLTGELRRLDQRLEREADPLMVSRLQGAACWLRTFLNQTTPPALRRTSILDDGDTTL